MFQIEQNTYSSDLWGSHIPRKWVFKKIKTLKQCVFCLFMVEVRYYSQIIIARFSSTWTPRGTFKYHCEYRIILCSIGLCMPNIPKCQSCPLSATTSETSKMFQFPVGQCFSFKKYSSAWYLLGLSSRLGLHSYLLTPVLLWLTFS